MDTLKKLIVEGNLSDKSQKIIIREFEESPIKDLFENIPKPNKLDVVEQFVCIHVHATIMDIKNELKKETSLEETFNDLTSNP
jgi:hypothetical protein